jgi:hypothetical protein
MRMILMASENPRMKKTRAVIRRALLVTSWLLATTPSLHAQAVRLELRPHPGDTLLLRIEQQTELIGSIIRGSRDSSITIRTSMLMFARAIVQRSDDDGAVVMAVADSVRTSSTPEGSADVSVQARDIQGKKVYMKVFPDGASELLASDATVSSVIRALIADMPATMPKGPVNVGATWKHVVHVPLESGSAPHSVSTTFRLDSLSSDKRMAYISMRGLIVEEEVRVPALPAAGQTSTSGDMTGNMTLDRLRGWIVNSIATITVNAIVRRPVESKLPDMNFQIRITQQMRTMNER